MEGFQEVRIPKYKKRLFSKAFVLWFRKAACEESEEHPLFFFPVTAGPFFFFKFSHLLDHSVGQAFVELEYALSP